MEEERRKGEEPVPKNLEGLLNKTQLVKLQNMEGFGWELKFIRRPLFQETVVVMFHPDNGKLGKLEEDGTLNMQIDIKVRQ